jgi:hypothetical protein
MNSFRTHQGRRVKGKELQLALYSVGEDLINLAIRIRKENAYADHVTEETKERILQDSLAIAYGIQKGMTMGCGLWFLQRLNTKLTGECIAILK